MFKLAHPNVRLIWKGNEKGTTCSDLREKREIKADRGGLPIFSLNIMVG